MANIIETIIRIFIFPGFLFLIALAFLLHWLDRKMIARFQGRVGPPWYQPVADLTKLILKEDILPKGTNQIFASMLPLVSFACVLTASFYAPIAYQYAASFEGDFVLVMFLLSIPSLLYFLAGWTTSGVYSIIGGNRSLLQYFSYEVLILLVVSGTAVASGSWSIANIRLAQIAGQSYFIPQIGGFLLGISGLIGKLKRSPYDIPKAKSEVIAGPLTEFSGKKLGLWFLTIQLQTVVGLSFLIHCFIAGFWQTNSFIGFITFLALLLSLQVVLSAASAIYARLRIDQLVHLNWNIFIPLALIHTLFILLK